MAVYIYVGTPTGPSPAPYCETNCETSTPVDSESVAPKMAELLQFYW